MWIGSSQGGVIKYFPIYLQTRLAQSESNVLFSRDKNKDTKIWTIGISRQEGEWNYERIFKPSIDLS